MAEVTEVESGDESLNPYPLAKEATGKSVDQVKMMPDNDEVEGSGSLTEETTDPVHHESEIPVGMTRKTSPFEETDFADGHVRRSSTTVIVGSNNKFQVRSRYLRTSVGSCHELCKYGHKHELEKKTKIPVLRKVREAKPLMGTANEEAKKKTFHRRLSLPGPPKTEKDPSTHVNMNFSEKDINKSELKRIQSQIKPYSVIAPGDSSSRTKSDSRAGKMTTGSRSSKEMENTSQRVKEIKTRKERTKEPIADYMSPKTPLRKSPSIKARLYKNLTSSTRSKNQSTSQEAKINGSRDVPEKTLHVIEPNADKKTSKVASPPKGTLNPPWGSQVRNIKQIWKIKAEVGSETNMPRAKSTKRAGTRLQEEKEGSPWKVKFKRGTVVALQVANSAPKKLRFKRRVVNDDQNAKVETTGRRLKNEEDRGDDQPQETKPETGKVRLRHQEASRKKDDVDLNNVIEETASMLVKTRKSKVKALVGAFETVMSLRERKPQVETGAS